MKTLPIHLDSGRRSANPRARQFGIPTSARAERGGGMMCPLCKEGRTRIIDSRPTDDGPTRRRRVCMSCAFRFTTMELYRPDFIPDYVI